MIKNVNYYVLGDEGIFENRGEEVILLVLEPLDADESREAYITIKPISAGEKLQVSVDTPNESKTCLFVSYSTLEKIAEILTHKKEKNNAENEQNSTE